MNGVLGHDSAPLRLYWVGDNLGECAEFCYESCHWHRIDRSAYWPAVQRDTTEPRMLPPKWHVLNWSSRTVTVCDVCNWQKPLTYQTVNLSMVLYGHIGRPENRLVSGI